MSAQEKGLLERKLLNASYYALYALMFRESDPGAASAFDTAARHALRQAEALHRAGCRAAERGFTVTDALAHAAQRELYDFTRMFPRWEQGYARADREEEARLSALLGQMARACNQRFCALVDASQGPACEAPRGFGCARCGYAIVAAAPPDACPVCGAARGAFLFA